MPDTLKNVKSVRLIELPSGQELRNFRRRLARHGNVTGRDAKSVLTTKFQLEIPERLHTDLPDFSNFVNTYNTIEQGCEKGTLAYFLFAVVLSGFRVFPTATEAKVFVNRAAYDEDGFRSAMEQAAGAVLPKFTVAAVLGRLPKEVRARGGKDARFVKEVIISEYRKSLCSSLPKGADEAVVKQIFEEIAHQLTSRFTSWGDLKNNLSEACSAVDDALAGFGKFPSLRAMNEKAGAGLPKNSTIAFDPKIPFCDIQENSGCLPYACVSTILSYPEQDPQTVDSAYVQKCLTTGSTASGLSWLFNKGLELFKSETEETLCALYGVSSEDIVRIRQLKAAALTVPEQTLLFNGSNTLGWRDFRTAFQGRLDSWVANYLKRLNELKELVSSYEGGIALPEMTRGNEDFLSVADCDRMEIECLIQQLSERRDRTLQALSNLQGAGTASVRSDIAEIENFSAVCSRLTAVRKKLVNVLELHEEDASSRWQGLYKEVKPVLEKWEHLKTIPKLNGMSGGVPCVEESLSAAVTHFASVKSAFEQHWKDLMEWIGQRGLSVDIVKSVQNQELARAGSRISGAEQAKELAVRKILQSVAGQVRNRRDAFADAVRQWFVSEAVFSKKKDFNRFFYNTEGMLYKSPFSTRKNAPYELGNDVIHRIDALWASILALIEEHRSRWSDFTPEFETWLRLRAMTVSMTVRSLDSEIPASVAGFRLDETFLGDAVPEDLKLLLQSQTVRPGVVGKVFNCYVSLMSGDLVVLRREKFYLRTKFQWVDNKALCYVPKAKSWKMPERYLRSKAWQPVLQSGLLKFTEDGCIDALKTFEAVAEAISPEKAYLTELLRQLPHDWCYRIPLHADKKAEQTQALVLKKEGSKGMQLSVRQIPSHLLCRLIGPSGIKSRLDALLTAPSQGLGDMTLLVDQEMSQRVDGASVLVKAQRTVFSLALPISTPMSKIEDRAIPFKRVVAVDQGEDGIAYAVFSLEDIGNAKAEPISVGTIRIPSIRRLIKAVNAYRRKGQTVQKFNQRFDSTMFTMRENVAGDVCGAIAGLMARYKAIPVLEREVRNLASGSRQLSMAYKMVNTKFINDGVQAHDLERAAWWFGVKVWLLPSLLEEISKEFFQQYRKDGWISIDGKYYRPLSVYPGVGVRAADTSRICSCCGNNIFQLITQAQKDGIKKISLNENGEATLQGKTFQLFAYPSKTEKKEARRRNERAAWVHPLANKTLTMSELYQRARENLRRAPKSLQSRDTSQSRYFCVFKECEKHNVERHADGNAAINIGRRFLGSVRFAPIGNI